MTDAGLGILTPELLVVRGPAGDTRAWARTWVTQAPRARARLSRADLAAMMYTPADVDHRTDLIVDAARIGVVETFLHRGVSVVVDGDVDDQLIRRLDAVAWACAGQLRVVDLRALP